DGEPIDLGAGGAPAPGSFETTSSGAAGARAAGAARTAVPSSATGATGGRARRDAGVPGAPDVARAIEGMPAARPRAAGAAADATTTASAQARPPADRSPFDARDGLE